MKCVYWESSDTPMNLVYGINWNPFVLNSTNKKSISVSPQCPWRCHFKACRSHRVELTEPEINL